MGMIMGRKVILTTIIPAAIWSDPQGHFECLHPQTRRLTKTAGSLKPNVPQLFWKEVLDAVLAAFDIRAAHMLPCVDIITCYIWDVYSLQGLRKDCLPVTSKH